MNHLQVDQGRPVLVLRPTTSSSPLIQEGRAGDRSVGSFLKVVCSSDDVEMKMLLLLAVLVAFGSAAQVCPENQEFKQCGTACPLTCDNYQTPPLACIFVCITGCACKAGFVQKSSGTSNIECVESKDCPNAPTNVTAVPVPINITLNSVPNVPECNKTNNEIYSTCASSCVPTCQEPNKDKGPCTLECIVGCVCDKGFVKNEQNSECVKPDQCPSADSNSTTLQPLPPVVPKCEKANQVFRSCGTACPPTCQDPNPQICTAVDCKIECQCVSGYFLNDAGDCVEPQYCPPLNDSATPDKPTNQECPPGKKWEDCGSPCPLKCNEPSQPTCVAMCEIGCSCVEGLVLTAAGDCVEPSKCPPPSNGSVTPQQPPEQTCDKPRQKWDSCHTACPPTCEEPNPQECTKDCKIGCACESGTLLNDQGDCVEAAQCPPLNDTALTRNGSIGHPLENNCTKPHESFLTCGTACPATCADLNAPNGPCTKNCVFGCFCDGGFVRSPSGDCVEPKDCANTTAPTISSDGASSNKTNGVEFIWLER